MSAQKPSAVLPDHLLVFEERLHQLERQRAIYTLLGIGITALIIWFGVNVANEANASPFSQGIAKIFDFPIDMVGEAWEAGWNWPPLLVKYFPELISTLNIAFFSTFLGFCFAIVLSCFASANLIKNPLIVQLVRRFLDIARSFPELVIVLVLLFLMGKNELPAIIAITIHTTGVLGKLFSEAIENIDTKPVDGLQSAGAGWSKRVRFAVLPQVLPILFSYTILRLEINVRASSILGFVGAGGIGEALNTVIQWRHGDDVTAILVLLILTITILDYLSSYLRARLIGARA
ncbi:MAG: phosphonate ABC transporter, permease protein PhnE [Pseudomonadota bacterium]